MHPRSRKRVFPPDVRSRYFQLGREMVVQLGLVQPLSSSYDQRLYRPARDQLYFRRLDP